YVKEISSDYYLSAVLPPDESIEIKLQVYDFSISRCLTVSINNLSFYEKNIGSNIGYIKDYLNSELNMFTRLEINAGRKGSVDIIVNYLDLMFYYYERGIYTIKPYKALVENYVDMSREAYVEAFKISSLSNGDIITKTGYLPIGYLRVSGGIDNLSNHIEIITTDNNTNSIPSTILEDDSNSLILSYGNVKTNIHSFELNSDTSISNIKFEYSYYGDAWEELTVLTEISEGETIVPNILIDLYGLQTVDYSSINPMSKVSLRSIWNVKLGELHNQEGSLSSMSNDYFNAVWQDIDRLLDIDLGSMRIVKDTESGVFDGSTGEVIKATSFNVGSYTDLDMLAYTLNKYTEPLTLGSSRLISKLKEELLTTESLNIDNRVKVIDAISEQLPNTSIIKNGFTEREVAGSQYLDYELYEPVKSGTKYKLIVEGEFKDNIEFISLYNSNPHFNETYIYPHEIING